LFAWVVYGRFLNTRIITAPIMIIVAIMAIVEMAKYISVGGWVTTWIGDAAGIALPTPM
jgi:hypothetical protein